MSSERVQREPLLTRENAKKAVRNPVEGVRHVTQRLEVRLKKMLYRDYETYYLSETKADVDEDPAAAVGPADLWEEMRTWQFEFLVKKAGLEEDDVLLDLGCGVLRGGIPLIEYLDVGNYYGMDISGDALEQGREAIASHDLADKDPTLVNNTDLRFQESELSTLQANVVWAQSVLTHLPPEQVQELLAHVDRVLDEGGQFYATWYKADEIVERANGFGFEYPLAVLQKWAGENGLSAEEVPCDHPNGLEMVVFQRRGSK